MKRVLVSGYYGFDNAGDEAILWALHQLFNPYDIHLQVLAAGVPYPSPDTQFDAIKRTDLPAIVNALKQSDLFLSGGGGLFQDVTGFGSIPYYGGLLWLAKQMGVPTMIFGQGIGPVRYGFNRRLLRSLMKGVQAIAVRDPESVAELLAMGVPKPSVFQMADPVLTLVPATPAHVRERLRAEGLDLRRPMIGVSIRPWKDWYEKQLKSFTAVLTQLALRLDAQIVLIPFQPHHDTWMCQEAAYSMGLRASDRVPPIRILEGHYSPIEMLGVIGHMDMVVGMRLHALIMAAAMGVPAVGIAYDPKVRLFSESVGYRYTSSVTALSQSDQFSELLLEAWEHRDAQRQHLGRTVPLLQQRVYDARALALKLLGIAENL